MTRSPRPLGRLLARHWLALYAYGLVLSVLVLLPAQSGLPPALWRVDWLSHGAGFAGLGFLLALALRREGLPRRRAWVIAFVASAVHGALTEQAQRLSPSRAAEWSDLLADAVGGLLGAGLGVLVTRGVACADAPADPDAAAPNAADAPPDADAPTSEEP